MVTMRDAGATTYAEQLRAVDDLKRQRASWRRDRALREQLATSQAQAGTLAGLDSKIATVDSALRRARAAAVTAIDAEAKAATGTRATELAGLRRRVAPAAATARPVPTPSPMTAESTGPVEGPASGGPGGSGPNRPAAETRTATAPATAIPASRNGAGGGAGWSLGSRRDRRPAAP